MGFLQKLLKESTDLLLVLDGYGSLKEVGDFFQQKLVQDGFSLRDISPLVASISAPQTVESYFHLHLKQLGVTASPFRLLYQDTNKTIYLGKDTTLAPTSSKRLNRDQLLHTLLDESSDPIFCFTEDGTYLYVNNIFANTFGYDKEEIIGKNLWDIFEEDEADRRYAMVKKTFLTGKTDTIEVKIPQTEGSKYFLTTVKPVKNQEGAVEIVICISKDITELRTAQDHIKTLTGILPICSSCKRIRDDKGEWNQLELYINKHSEAQFSHGICPDCIDQHYSDFTAPSQPKKK